MIQWFNSVPCIWTLQNFRRCSCVAILCWSFLPPWGTTTTPTSEELSKVNSSARVNHSVEIPGFPIPLNHMKARNHPNICESWDLMPEPHFWFPEGFAAFFATGLRSPLEVLLSWFSREKFRSSIGARSARGGYPARDGWNNPQQNKVLVSRFNFSTHLKHV